MAFTAYSVFSSGFVGFFSFFPSVAFILRLVLCVRFIANDIFCTKWRQIICVGHSKCPFAWLRIDELMTEMLRDFVRLFDILPDRWNFWWVRMSWDELGLGQSFLFGGILFGDDSLKARMVRANATLPNYSLIAFVSFASVQFQYFPQIQMAWAALRWSSFFLFQ